MTQKKAIRQTYGDKTYQYLRDYHNGTKKVSAVKYPPTPKRRKGSIAPSKNYDRKLLNSIARSKRVVAELAMCNPWAYFATFTIDKKRHDHTDIDGFMKAFTKWLSNFSYRKLSVGKRIDYLLIPERNSKGRWHVHGLIQGLPRRFLSEFVQGEHPQRLVDCNLLNWKDYQDKFGYCGFQKVKSSVAAARYSMKGVKKNLPTQMRGLSKRLYYCSKGLKRSEIVARGYNIVPIIDYDYGNEWVAVKWICDNSTHK